MKYYRPNKSYPTTSSSNSDRYSKDRKNLNLSNTKHPINTDADVKIDKWLSYSYSFFAPFFEDEGFKNTYRKAHQMNSKEESSAHSHRSWIASLFHLISNLWGKLLHKNPKELNPRQKNLVKNFSSKNKCNKPSNSFKKNSSSL
jgi:hypothetical protein